MTEPVADIAIMLGLLNWNLGSKDLNMEYTKNMIRTAFSLSKELLIVDFLSSVHDPCYSPEEPIFYHNPSEIVELAVRFSSNFNLLHDYLPIP